MEGNGDIEFRELRVYSMGDYRVEVDDSGDWTIYLNGALGLLNDDAREAIFDNQPDPDSTVSEWLEVELASHMGSLQKLLLEVAGEEGR